MFTITEPKIAGLTPRWSPHPGFSVLFDAPGAPFLRGEGIETLACDVAGDPALDFYRLLDSGLGSLKPDLLFQAYGFCALPPASYHVTAFDVANVADLPHCHDATRGGLQATLDLLPAPEAFEDPLLARAREFAEAAGGVTFRYGELRVWNVIAVQLEPTDAAAYARFVAARAELSRTYRATYGVGAKETHTPHVTLGYFANAAGAELASARRSEWDGTFRKLLGEIPLAFASASLYGFTDMATFFRKA